MNLLVIQTAFIGDVVLTTPLMQAARERLDARVTVVVRPSTAELLRHHPGVDEVVAYDKHGTQRGIGGLFRLARRLRAGRFDAALLPHRSMRSALLAWRARIPVRVGFETSGGRRLMTHRVPYRPVHEVERNLDLLQLWMPPPVGSIRPCSNPARYAPALFPDDRDRASADDLLAAHGITPAQPLIGLSPGSVWATKRWLPERFAEVARRAARTLGARIVLFGGPDDVPLCDEIARQAGGAPVVTAGRLSLLASAALASRCAAVVSNDTGMAHIAAAMGTPVIALFGPTVPAFGFTPYGDGHRIVERPLPCRPCSRHGGARCPLRTHACMKEIGVEIVMEAVGSVGRGAEEQRSRGAQEQF